MSSIARCIQNSIHTILFLDRVGRTIGICLDIQGNVDRHLLIHGRTLPWHEMLFLLNVLEQLYKHPETSAIWAITMANDRIDLLCIYIYIYIYVYIYIYISLCFRSCFGSSIHFARGKGLSRPNDAESAKLRIVCILTPASSRQLVLLAMSEFSWCRSATRRKMFKNSSPPTKCRYY